MSAPERTANCAHVAGGRSDIKETRINLREHDGTWLPWSVRMCAACFNSPYTVEVVEDVGLFSLVFKSAPAPLCADCGRPVTGEHCCTCNLASPR